MQHTQLSSAETTTTTVPTTSQSTTTSSTTRTAVTTPTPTPYSCGNESIFIGYAGRLHKFITSVDIGETSIHVLSRYKDQYIT